MTFLEYVIEHYLGLPIRKGQEGESYWRCPECNHERFHTMPWKPEYRHRYRCFRCDLGGDAADFIKVMHPELPYGDRRDVLEELEREYKARGGASESTSVYSPGERGVQKEETEEERIEREEVEKVKVEYVFNDFTLLLEEKAEKWPAGLVGMYALCWADRVARDNGISLDALVVRCARYLRERKRDVRRNGTCRDRWNRG